MMATRYRRPDADDGSAWILLHGMTRTGRRHSSLIRFARAIASTGSTVLVPEVPEWVALDLAPGRTRDAVEAGLAFLEADAGVLRPPGLMGFSFGGPQALRVATSPDVARRISCVASFGGYGEMLSTLRFLLTGVHEWGGSAQRVRPDPYGRWIVAANYLTGVRGFQDAAPLADALRELAAYAGDHGIQSWDAELDSLKDALATGIPPEWEELYRFFAPPASADPPAASNSTEEWAHRLVSAGMEMDPEMDLPEVMEIGVPTYLVHGRNDHLIPVSEVHRLARRVRAPRLEVTVTRLFAHSTGDPKPRGAAEWIRETGRLGRTLYRLFSEV
jgi:pimeloyl-ACP methyl ester carboxylesterase